MIPKCRPDSVVPFDATLLGRLSVDYRLDLEVDEYYLSVLPYINGGEPLLRRFQMPNGDSREIGWFVSFLEKRELLDGHHEAIYYPDSDARLADRSIPTILVADEVDIFNGGERIFPFAALFSKEGSPPLSLRFYSFEFRPDDSLCFDMNDSPPSIVYCDGIGAAEAALRLEDGEVESLEYSCFLTPIVGSFREFVSLLT